ncbi:MAG: 3-deoxy-manno-octulosonate cytidylyltransferase [Deltaproteobacteria bacterium]|nr:3-deoxy-manno-octulosonate cytidylyltransferase [Deltaproteobacteria bacterium]
MGPLPQCYGIIPARYRSKRFPGKPLAEIHGKPMFWHVYKQAEKCRHFSRIVLATDDERIFSAAKALLVPVLMTDANHPSGTDRVLEAANALDVPDDAVVVNIQGDEPLLSVDMLDRLIAPFSASEIQITTLAKKIGGKEADNPDRVKVVIAENGQALYFSRSKIPYYRGDAAQTFYGHIGLYAFRMAALRAFQRLGPGRLERIESLEQLRLLENKMAIHVIITDHASIGVDTPDDLKTVTRMMNQTMNQTIK